MLTLQSFATSFLTFFRHLCRVTGTSPSTGKDRVCQKQTSVSKPVRAWCTPQTTPFGLIYLAVEEITGDKQQSCQAMSKGCKDKKAKKVTKDPKATKVSKALTVFRDLQVFVATQAKKVQWAWQVPPVLKGRKAQPGKDGTNGAKGAAGDPGLNGASGAPGLKGQKGEPGVDGADGPKGDIGPAGVDGISPNPIQLPKFMCSYNGRDEVVTAQYNLDHVKKLGVGYYRFRFGQKLYAQRGIVLATAYGDPSLEFENHRILTVISQTDWTVTVKVEDPKSEQRADAYVSIVLYLPN